MTLELIKEKLSDRNVAEVARRLGVTRAYLNAVKNGSVEKLSDHMHDKLKIYFEVN